MTTHRIHANDVVLHKPSGEKWVVCGVCEDRLIACGYPFPTMAPISDCVLLEECDIKQTEEQKTVLRLHGLGSYIERDSGGEDMGGERMMHFEPCPFCGSKTAIVITDAHREEDCANFEDETCPHFKAVENYINEDEVCYTCVVCSVLSGGCGASSGWARGSKSIEKWNRRT